MNEHRDGDKHENDQITLPPLPSRRSQRIRIDGRIYWSIIFALLSTAAAAVIIFIIAPFAASIGWAILIGVPTFRYFRILQRKISHPNICASIMVLAVTLCLILPISMLGYFVIERSPEWLAQGEQALQNVTTYQIRDFSAKPAVKRIFDVLERIGMDVTEHAARLTSHLSQHVVNAATVVVKNIASIIIDVLVMLFILFFLYRDGGKIVSGILLLFPDNQRKSFHYLYEINSTTTGVVVGTIFTSVVQGVLAGIGYFVAGLPVPALLGLLTAIAGLVPVVGTTIVWGPLSLILLLNGSYLKGILLAVWGGAVIVGFSDMVIRPLSAAGTSEVHPLAIVVGAIGGAVSLGAIGLLLGPIILGMLITIWRDFTGDRPL